MSDLVARIGAAGFAVEVSAGGPRLVSVERGAVMPRDLLAEVKANRLDLLAFLRSGREPESEGERCPTCAVGPGKACRPTAVQLTAAGVFTKEYAPCPRR